MSSSEEADLKARCGGLVFAGLGAVLLKLSFFNVLREAEAHVPSLSASGKGVVIAPFLLLIGLLLMIFGAPVERPSGLLGRLIVRPSDGRLSTVGRVLVIATVIPGLVLYIWLGERLKELGYE